MGSGNCVDMFVMEYFDTFRILKMLEPINGDATKLTETEFFTEHKRAKTDLYQPNQPQFLQRTSGFSPRSGYRGYEPGCCSVPIRLAVSFKRSAIFTAHRSDLLCTNEIAREIMHSQFSY